MDENKEKSLEDLINDLKEQDFFKNLNGDSLKYFDNIISNILELKKLNDNKPFEGSTWIWAILFMFLFSSPFNNTPLWGVERSEDTTGEELNSGSES